MAGIASVWIKSSAPGRKSIGVFLCAAAAGRQHVVRALQGAATRTLTASVHAVHCLSYVTIDLSFTQRYRASVDVYLEIINPLRSRSRNIVYRVCTAIYFALNFHGLRPMAPIVFGKRQIGNFMKE
jgi:hypothetical protein